MSFAPIVAVLLVLGAPLAALAQGPRDTTTGPLQSEIRQRRIIVQPLPDSSVVNRDVDEAVSSLKGEQRIRREAQEAVMPQRRRPDLGYDVSSGIQTRSVDKLLRP
jgi:hypothetical protein